MLNFPFTRKRFLSLPTARRHKWVTNWLKENYIEVINHKYTDDSLDLFFKDFQRVRTWLNENEVLSNKPDSRQKWLEFISDQFHDHQKKTGKGLAESNLLPRINLGDKKPGEAEILKIPYQVALDNIRSAFNVGSIFRLVDAVGFESIVLSPRTPGKENRQVQKTAMGCSDWINETKSGNLADTLDEARKSGFTIIGLETVQNTSYYFEYPWPKKGVIVLGNEEYGISSDVLKVCDDFISLPMSGLKNSINVATAFAVVAFHISSIFNTNMIHHVT